jgi:homocysteine S-methyltransferase
MRIGKSKIEIKITDELKHHKLIADGAFGTYYPIRFPEAGEEIPELANIKYPDKVTAIHREYIDAGAGIIRTNTFAANTTALKTDMEGINTNIKSAIRAARAAVGNSGTLIAGDIGPILSGKQNQSQIEEEYINIGKLFLDNGINIIFFETFPELDVLIPVARALKAYKDCFILVQFSVNQFGYSNAGLSARRLIADGAAEEAIDALGLNCGVGPGHMEQIISNINIDCGKYISLLPNAGYPKLVQNRLTFTDNVDYFTRKMENMAALGGDILGGCCGTNPDYIRSLKEHLICNQTGKHKLSEDRESKAEKAKSCSFIQARLENKNHKLIAVELAPPVNANDEKLLDAAHILQNAGVDVVNFPDSPSGRTRADSILMAEKVRRETGLKVMPHICCRDKNAIALRSQIIGAKLNDIHDFLVITGDPVPVLFRQSTRSVFNFDSVGLMKIMEEMNQDIFTDTKISYGGAINHNRLNIDIEIQRVRKKMDAGAEFFLTQPVFSMKEVETLRHIKAETGALILVGIMPLVSRRNAIFMKNEMTGINITDEIINRYDEDMSREEGEACGIAISQEFIDASWDFADGYYLSFPFNRVHMLGNLVLNH